MAKAAAVVQESNVVELRKNGPAEDAVVALQLGKMKRAKEEFDSANGTYRNTMKHVEAKGIHLAAAKDAIAIQKSGKVEEKVAYLKALFEYLMILGQPIDKKQLDMFRVEEPRTPGIEKARQHGRYIGIMGLGQNENPYSPESDQGQAWLEAWHGGCEERGMVMAMDTPGDELIKGDDPDDEMSIDDIEDDGDAEESDDDEEWDAAAPETADEN